MGQVCRRWQSRACRRGCVPLARPAARARCRQGIVPWEACRQRAQHACDARHWHAACIACAACTSRAAGTQCIKRLLDLIHEGLGVQVRVGGDLRARGQAGRAVTCGSCSLGTGSLPEGWVQELVAGRVPHSRQSMIRGSTVAGGAWLEHPAWRRAAAARAASTA